LDYRVTLRFAVYSTCHGLVYLPHYVLVLLFAYTFVTQFSCTRYHTPHLQFIPVYRIYLRGSCRLRSVYVIYTRLLVTIYWFYVGSGYIYLLRLHFSVTVPRTRCATRLYVRVCTCVAFGFGLRLRMRLLPFTLRYRLPFSFFFFFVLWLLYYTRLRSLCGYAFGHLPLPWLYTFTFLPVPTTFILRLVHRTCPVRTFLPPHGYPSGIWYDTTARCHTVTHYTRYVLPCRRATGLHVVRATFPPYLLRVTFIMPVLDTVAAVVPLPLQYTATLYHLGIPTVVAVHAFVSGSVWITRLRFAWTTRSFVPYALVGLDVTVPVCPVAHAHRDLPLHHLRTPFPAAACCARGCRLGLPFTLPRYIFCRLYFGLLHHFTFTYLPVAAHFAPTHLCVQFWFGSSQFALPHCHTATHTRALPRGFYAHTHTHRTRAHLPHTHTARGDCGSACALVVPTVLPPDCLRLFSSRVLGSSTAVLCRSRTHHYGSVRSTPFRFTFTFTHARAFFTVVRSYR